MDEKRRILLIRQLRNMGVPQSDIEEVLPSQVGVEPEVAEVDTAEKVTVTAEKSQTDTLGIVMVLCIAAALIILLTD